MIKNEVLKTCLDNKGFLESLQLLFNKIFNDGKYPTSWKTEPRRPLHKKEETYLEKNYRGISLTSYLGKYFNNLLLTRLSKCFEDLRVFQDHMMGQTGEPQTTYLSLKHSLINSSTKMKNYTVVLLISLKPLIQYGEKACLQN